MSSDSGHRAAFEVNQPVAATSRASRCPCITPRSGWSARSLSSRLPGRRAALALTSSNAICWEVRHAAASRAPRSPHTLSAQGTSQAIRVVAASRALHSPCDLHRVRPDPSRAVVAASRALHSPCDRAAARRQESDRTVAASRALHSPCDGLRKTRHHSAALSTAPRAVSTRSLFSLPIRLALAHFDSCTSAPSLGFSSSRATPPFSGPPGCST